MANGDIFRAQWNLSVNGNPAAFGVHFEIFSGGSGDDPNGALTAGLQTKTVGLLPCLAQDVNLVSLESYSAGIGLHPPSLGVFVPTAGTFPDQALPLTKAVVVRHEQTDNPGRFNGRTYFPGIAESLTTGNEVSNVPLLGLIEDFFDSLSLVTFDSGVNVYEFVPIVKTGPNAPVANPRIVNNVANPIIYSQRRRRTRRRGALPAV